MDNPNLTMEEYIRLEEEKARKRGKVFNGNTATYGKIRIDDDLHDLSSMEAEFPDINLCALFGVSFDPKRYYKDGDCAIMLRRPRSIRHMALPPRDQRHMFLIFEGMEYLDTDIVDFDGRLARIHREGAQGSVFDSLGVLQDFDGEGLFSQAILDLDTLGTLQFQLGGARRRMSWRQFILALGLHTDEEMQTFTLSVVFSCSLNLFCLLSLLGSLLFLFLLKNPWHQPRLHRDYGNHILGYVPSADSFVSIAGMRYLRLFTAGRKSGDYISVIAPELSVINMAELVRLQICVKLDDTWAWVAMGPERQPNNAAGAPVKAEDALIVDEEQSLADLVKEIMTNIGGEFSNLEDLEVLEFLKPQGYLRNGRNTKPNRPKPDTEWKKHDKDKCQDIKPKSEKAPPPVVEPFNLEEPIENPAPPLAPMDDTRTMAQLLQAPTEGYEDAIVIPEINANFELKHGDSSNSIHENQ
ncbi:hypothetical protein Tco_0648260 [Tanacetum coccineum]